MAEKIEINGMLSSLLWFVIPGWIASGVQTFYYTLTRKSVVKGSAKYVEHRRNILIAVVSTYLAYTLVSSYRSVVYGGGVSGDFYADLGVPAGATAQQLRSAYRKMGVVYHPDKIGAEEDEGTWLQIKVAYEALSDATTRFAYDRFGRQAVAWATPVQSQLSSAVQTVSKVEIIQKGLIQSVSPYYLLSLFSMMTLRFFGVGRSGATWRYYILLVGFLIELTLVVRPHMVPHVLILKLLPFQAVQLLRQLLISIYIGINQIAPLFEPPAISTGTLSEALDHLEFVSQQLAQEGTSSLAYEHLPFKSRAFVKQKLESQMLELQLRNDPEVADAVLQNRKI